MEAAALSFHRLANEFLLLPFRLHSKKSFSLERNFLLASISFYLFVKKNLNLMSNNNNTNFSCLPKLRSLLAQEIQLKQTFRLFGTTEDSCSFLVTAAVASYLEREEEEVS